MKPILTEKVTSFYNSNKISQVVPHKNATVLVKNSDGTKERVCLRILEKTIEATYHSFCNENPECSIKVGKFGELCPRNVRLRKIAQRAVCCCTIHVNVDYLWKTAVRYSQIIERTQELYHAMKSFVVTFSVKNQTSNATTKNPLTAKQSPWHGLKICSKCYVENVDFHAQDHVINFKQFERI